MWMNRGTTKFYPFYFGIPLSFPILSFCLSRLLGCVVHAKEVY